MTSIKEFSSNVETAFVNGGQILANDTKLGETVDTAGKAGGITFSTAIIDYSDGSYGFEFQENDVEASGDAGWGPIAPEKIYGDLRTAQTELDKLGDPLPQISAISTKRYLRINIISTGVTSGAFIVVFVSKMNNLTPTEIIV